MSEEARFFLLIFAMGFCAFTISSIIEILLLNRSQKLGEKSAAGYVLGSNFLGVIVMCVFAGLLAGTAVVFFGATMGGAFWLSLVSIVVVLLSLVLTTLLMFVGRHVAARLIGIPKERLNWVYGAGVSVVNFLFVIAFIFGVFAILTALSQMFEG